MAINFTVGDFLYPLALLKMGRFLEQSQWFTEEQLREYQLQRLREVLGHAYRNVPYYQGLLEAQGFAQGRINGLDDLRRLPLLTKDLLKKNAATLRARNSARFSPRLTRSSGSSGEPVSFLTDKPSRVMEFCYYRRYWSWAGYRLGMTFAQLSFHYFMEKGSDAIAEYSPLTRRLMLNSAKLSQGSIGSFVEMLRKYRPAFIKGSPSTLYVFALLLEKQGYRDIAFKAVFTTGEMLLPNQRALIERVLHCPILDSYGLMERCVSISQCPRGSYHLHSEYGIMEIEKDDRLSSGDTVSGRLIATSLHNFAMPFIRYDTGDIVEVPAKHEQCACGRGLPVIRKIHGRTQGIIVTRDGRLLTNTFVLLQSLRGVAWYQLVQDEIDRFRLRMVKDVDFDNNSLQNVLATLRSLLGPTAGIDVEYVAQGQVQNTPEKYMPVVTRVRGYTE